MLCGLALTGGRRAKAQRAGKSCSRQRVDQGAAGLPAGHRAARRRAGVPWGLTAPSPALTVTATLPFLRMQRPVEFV